jgi:hypothetical protein
VRSWLPPGNGPVVVAAGPGTNWDYQVALATELHRRGVRARLIATGPVRAMLFITDEKHLDALLATRDARLVAYSGDWQDRAAAKRNIATLDARHDAGLLDDEDYLTALVLLTGRTGQGYAVIAYDGPPTPAPLRSGL